MGPHPAVAEVRRAVRRGLDGLAAGDLVLAACSGGADSLALAAALAYEAPRPALRAGGVTVDHGLQPGSAERARRVAAVLAGLGLDPVEAVPVTVAAGPGAGGPEAAARGARYQALDEAAGAPAPAAVLLGHSLDDQAETVLLGLARGSGARSLAGMAARRGRYRRPLLGVRRATTAGCVRRPRPAALGRPAQRRPRLRPGPGPAPGAPGAGDGARPGGGAGARPHGRPAADRRGGARRTGQPPRCRCCVTRTAAGWPPRSRPRPPRSGPACCGWRRSRPGAPREAHRPARRRARRPGDPLARAALGHPSRGSPRPCSNVAG